MLKVPIIYSKYNSSFNNQNDICGGRINNVEIRKCFRNMNNGKAAGPDGIVAEHIRTCMPEAVTIDYIYIPQVTVPICCQIPYICGI